MSVLHYLALLLGWFVLGLIGLCVVITLGAWLVSIMVRDD